MIFLIDDYYTNICMVYTEVYSNEINYPIVDAKQVCTYLIFIRIYNAIND